ncbi:S-adenosyl-L-methionine-dependent methyltransferase [Coniochaeta hoffmannii]|uniref:S-adenosyl-L-methionine-dependent methyltransferase n=1 Tax=Coniochaeta hoffmannii TaxID=91930 RepID=A0AA38VKH1_9PEZI|nr:S-adenosyl-L-methionine-dependent methyltransferase [Coniochaeta hoffmannii]
METATQPPGEAPVLEPDPNVGADDNNDADSAVDSGSVTSSTDSLTDSIYDYRKLHGRPYQKSETTEYWAPVDDTQNEGLDIIHNVLLMSMDDQLTFAPIGDNPGNVLDVGTGTGIWAIDFADQYSSAEVTGTDISPIQPRWVPPNCRFFIEDCVLDWTWPPDRFDFIHLRAMYGCIPDWEALYRKAFKHLKPGGWFEDVEMDVKIESDHVSIPDDHIFNKWADLFYQGGDKMGRSFTISQGHTMKELMEKVGFVDVVEKKIKIPLHGWPKDPRLRNVGLLAQLALDQSLDGFGTFMLTQIHGWDPTQAAVYIAKMRKETRKASNCPWYMTTVVYGRKPKSKD